MPEAFDRRNENRDAAAWVRKELENLTKMLGDTRMDVVVGNQQLDGRLTLLDEKVNRLHETLLSAYDGTPEAHRRYHSTENERIKQEAEDKEDERKQKRADRHKIKLAGIGLLITLATLGAIDWARNFVLGVEQGKSSMELQKNEPVKIERHPDAPYPVPKPQGRSEGKERFNR